jgi:hypothetical protein
MRITASTALLAFVFALPAMAQTEGQDRPAENVEKLWKIEATGISG